MDKDMHGGYEMSSFVVNGGEDYEGGGVLRELRESPMGGFLELAVVILLLITLIVGVFSEIPAALLWVDFVAVIVYAVYNVYDDWGIIKAMFGMV